MSTKFTLPELPYAYDALGPYMSEETLEFHHDKHHQAYVTNGEKLLEGSGLEILPLEDIVKEAFGKNAGLFNNAGQHYNHVHFWNWMKPNGGGNKLPGALCRPDRRAISAASTSSAPISSLPAPPSSVRGWAWLSLKNGKLEVTKTPTAKARWSMAASRCSASTCGSTPITSTTAMPARNTWKPGSTIW